MKHICQFVKCNYLIDNKYFMEYVLVFEKRMNVRNKFQELIKPLSKRYNDAEFVTLQRSIFHLYLLTCISTIFQFSLNTIPIKRYPTLTANTRKLFCLMYLRTYKNDNNKVKTKVSTIPTSRIFALSIIISDDIEPLYSKNITTEHHFFSWCDCTILLRRFRFRHPF